MWENLVVCLSPGWLTTDIDLYVAAFVSHLVIYQCLMSIIRFVLYVSISYLINIEIIINFILFIYSKRSNSFDKQEQCYYRKFSRCSSSLRNFFVVKDLKWNLIALIFLPLIWYLIIAFVYEYESLYFLVIFFFDRCKIFYCKFQMSIQSIRTFHLFGLWHHICIEDRNVGDLEVFNISPCKIRAFC